MAVVKSDVGDGYVLHPPEGVILFLLHGSDVGLIQERASRLVNAIKRKDGLGTSVVRMDMEVLAREPNLLLDEMSAIDMFGGSRIVAINGAYRDLSAALTPVFTSRPRDFAVVVQAGNLKKGTNVRLMFEQTSWAASIECYPDDQRTLGNVIDAEATIAGLKISTEARGKLLSLLGSDRLTSRSEINKLMIYCDGSTQISLDDVDAVVSNAAPSIADRLIEAALSGNLINVITFACRYFAEDGNAVYIVSRLISRIELLHQYKLSLSADRPADTIQPAAIFRLPSSQRHLLIEQATQWSTVALQRRMLWAQEIMTRVRKQPGMSELLATRALYALASGRGPQNR